MGQGRPLDQWTAGPSCRRDLTGRLSRPRLAIWIRRRGLAGLSSHGGGRALSAHVLRDRRVRGPGVGTQRKVRYRSRVTRSCRSRRRRRFQAFGIRCRAHRRVRTTGSDLHASSSMDCIAVTVRPSRTCPAARGESPAAFGGRGILSGGVAPRSNMPNILPRRALPASRLARLGATRDFHHGLLGSRAPIRIGLLFCVLGSVYAPTPCTARSLVVLSSV